jgi:hypothetical protein
MTFDQLFQRLDQLLRERSADFEEMRRLVAEIQKAKEVCRWLDSAQDRLYASIASGHLKVLQHLEAGDIEQAKEEAAAAVAWFHLRFRAFQPDSAGRFPQITDVFARISGVAEQSATLRGALARPDIDSQFSPGGKSNDAPIR